jgi:hypothetical protein
LSGRRHRKRDEEGIQKARKKETKQRKPKTEMKRKKNKSKGRKQLADQSSITSPSPCFQVSFSSFAR